MRYNVCMIKKTVYFRTQEDLDKFNAIKNKAEWLHDHLIQPNPKHTKWVKTAGKDDPEFKHFLKVKGKK